MFNLIPRSVFVPPFFPRGGPFFFRPARRPVPLPAFLVPLFVPPCFPLVRRPVLSCRGTGSSSPWRRAFRCRVDERAEASSYCCRIGKQADGVPSSRSVLSSRIARLGRCEAHGGGVFPRECSCRLPCVMRLVWAIQRAGSGICVVVEMSDVVAFRFPVVDCPCRAPFRLLVARLIQWGVAMSR